MSFSKLQTSEGLQGSSQDADDQKQRCTEDRQPQGRRWLVGSQYFFALGLAHGRNLETSATQRQGLEDIGEQRAPESLLLK
jgi:hypothetical protein